MMAAIAHGTDALINRCAALLARLPALPAFEPEPAPPPTPAGDARDIRIARSGDAYEVDAPWLLPVVQSVNFDDYESLQYFQRVLQSSGVIAALTDAGVSEGDTVRIFDIEFDFVL